jgi:hypothetical protein
MKYLDTGHIGGETADKDKVVLEDTDLVGEDFVVDDIAMDGNIPMKWGWLLILVGHVSEVDSGKRLRGVGGT